MNCVGTFVCLQFDLAFSISMVSHAGCMKVGFTINSEAVNPKDFKKLYLKNIDEMLGGKDWRKYHEQRNGAKVIPLSAPQE